MTFPATTSSILVCAGSAPIDPDQPPLTRQRYSFRNLDKALIMTKPISDKAEVAVEYPDKLYIGTFAHTARFDAHLDQTGISLTLELLARVDNANPWGFHFTNAY